MSKKHSASSIIEEAKNWADETLSDYAYKHGYTGKKGKNSCIYHNLLVNRFSFILQIILALLNILFISFSPCIFYNAEEFGLVSILFLCVLFMVQAPLICYTADKCFNRK